MFHVAGQTREEWVAMYMKRPKHDLAEMLVNAYEILERSKDVAIIDGFEMVGAAEDSADVACDPATKLAVTAWVLEKIVANVRAGGTYRGLIYGEMGFDEGAYFALLKNGMLLHNWLAELDELREKTGSSES